ncbi:ADP-ribosyltransferase domain-containing protein [Limnospira platensis]|uniref:ADP-ribosyltransferase domain-containing protein n=1 Tax=Limnospira platensis TaxID=118562 RepID=UPI000280405B|nr:hypothetical protein SPLC1_S090220 [Arthrospira platensis C1]UWU51011.1 NAD:arginine ADP-ribosyltransferase [Arthrospira platensis C1]
MPQTSFDIEDAELLLKKLKDFQEVIDVQWSRVINQWFNLKLTWHDYHFYEFEEIVGRLSYIYSSALQDCDRCINLLQNKIDIAESVNDLENCLQFLEHLYDPVISSSHSPTITSVQKIAYSHKILKGLSHMPKIFLEKAKAKLKGAYAKLGTEAGAALIFYTSQSLGYQQINRLLRGQIGKFAATEKEIGWNVVKAKRDYQEHIKFITEALNQLPNYEGVVFRGSKMNPDQLAQYKVGNIVTEKGLISSSKQLAVAQNFSANVFYTIFSKTGKDISDLSEFAGEEEVAFRPGTKFKVVGIEQKDEKTCIKMIEV